MVKAIPKFDCKAGCDDCCGIVPFSLSEMIAASERHPLVAWEPFANGTYVSTSAASTLKCPFSENGCKIYDIRPTICRLFGAVDHPRMTCPHECGPKKKLSDAQAQVHLREVA